MSPTDWPVPCHRCGGKGTFTVYAFGRLIGERDKTLLRVWSLKSRPATCERVLDRVHFLFPESC